jgi:histidine triad (HIT) family protein
MGSIFTRIIQGEIPCHFLAEDDQFFAFLDIRPLTRGHALVIPRNETDYLFDMNMEDLKGILPFAAKVAKAIQTCVPCERIGISVVGLEVPHAHIHLIPINSVRDMNFSNEPVSMSSEEMAELASAIRQALS